MAKKREFERRAVEQYELNALNGLLVLNVVFDLCVAGNIAVKRGHGRLALLVAQQEHVLADLPELAKAVPRGQIVLEEARVALHARRNLLLDL